MNTHEELELKKEFQLERIILFSDAVFAIILTIMVIELKLPESIRDAATEEFKHEFNKIYLHILIYAVSFFFLGMFWTRHVNLLGYLRDYNKPFLFLNLTFLFTVSLFPFAASMLPGLSKEHSIQAVWGFNVYLIVIMASLFSFTLLTGYMIRNKEKLCYNVTDLETKLKWKVARAQYVVIPLMLVLLCVFNLLNIPPKYCGFVMGLYGIIVGRLSKYYYPNAVSGGRPILSRMFTGRKKRIQKVNQLKQEQET